MAEPPESVASSADPQIERELQAEADSQTPGANVRLGDYLSELGRTQEAERSYRRGLELGDRGAGVLLGDLLTRLGRVDEARDAYAAGVSRGDPEAGARLDALAASATLPPSPSTSPSDDFATEAPQPPPEAAAATPPPEEFDFLSNAAADLPTDKDLLGFGALVEAMHSLLDDERTALPLALAVTAPWGAGKSSVMWQLRERLMKPPEGMVTNRSWYTVRFDAWKYEHSERLWAALAKAIYDQPQQDMSWHKRLGFRIELEYKRLSLWRFLLKFAWPLLLAAGAVVIALSVDLGKAGAGAAGLATVAAICAAVARYWNTIVNPFKRAMERYASAPDYEAHLGFTAEADRDIQALTELLCPQDSRRGLAIFVDDLDRCSSTHVVEVVEAMNQIFNSDARNGCVFVLGLDREVVATNINVAYKDTVEELRKVHSPVGEDFGFHFLAKLVQMSVAIPPPRPDALRELLSSITHNGAGPSPSEPLPVSEAEVQVASQAVVDERAPNLASVGEQVAPSPNVRPEAVAEAVRRQRARRIRDSREVIAAEFNGLAYLDRNPRQVKRFHNAFRLQLYVANADPRLEFDFTADQLIALSRWVALRVRWPSLAQDVDKDPDLLASLEEYANNQHAVSPPDSSSKWFARRELIEVLHEPEQSRRINELPFQDFLQVA